MKTSLFLSTAIGALLVTGVAAAADAPINFVLDSSITDGVLSGENELPTAVNATDTGTVKLTFYPDKKQLCGTITFNPAGFEYTAAHIHEGAADKTGTNYVTLAGDKGAGEIKVNVTDMTTEQITKLTTGESYVNVHSEAHPDGAMRNQLVQDDQATEQPCEGGEDTDAGASSSGASSSGASSSGSSGSSSGASSSGSTSSSGTAATPASTDDGGCNTSGSHGADAAALLALGAIVTAAARKRRKKA